MVKRQIARLRGGHRFFFGGAGGAPTRPARLNGDAVIWRIASSIPNTSDETPAIIAKVETWAPTLAQLALRLRPGSICYMMYAA